MGHGYLSKAVFILIYRSHSYRWAAVVPRSNWLSWKRKEAEGTLQNDIALLANTSNQGETLQYSLEWAATGIGLHINAHKTEYMCYNQTGNIFTLDETSRKLVDKFTYLGSSVSSTEKEIDTANEGMDSYR